MPEQPPRPAWDEDDDRVETWRDDPGVDEEEQFDNLADHLTIIDKDDGWSDDEYQEDWPTSDSRRFSLTVTFVTSRVGLSAGASMMDGWRSRLPRLGRQKLDRRAPMLHTKAMQISLERKAT